MANPARVEMMLVGVSRRSALPTVARALASSGVRSAWVVHGDAGGGAPLDEMGLAGPNEVMVVANGHVDSIVVDGRELGFGSWTADDIAGGDAARNAAVVRDTLAGADGAVREVVLLNSAAALVVAGRADDLADAVGIAVESIDSGRALASLESAVACSRRGSSASRDDSDTGGAR
jgi:anthranilate phosphoribosyltransferase